jgi:hypothetical protein
MDDYIEEPFVRGLADITNDTARINYSKDTLPGGKITHGNCFAVCDVHVNGIQEEMIEITYDEYILFNEMAIESVMVG